MNNNLIKNIDIQRIAKEGTKVYERIKSDYDPKERGKFMAIEIDTKSVYLAETSAEDVRCPDADAARKKHPNKIFYVVKIGFDVAETMAHSFLNKK
jgi:hypothetical protein